jgi:zinc protease
VLQELASGLRVVLQENHSAPVVALQVWVDAGSADDPADRSGLAHVLEHMVFKGSARRSESQIAEEIEGSGGHVNAWTAFDQTVFHLVIASRYFERGLDILSDALLAPRFDEKDLARELEVIGEEIKQGEDSPGKVVSRLLFGAAYGPHPYGRSVIGRDETVRKIRPADVRAFHARHYAPPKMTLVVVGDVAPERAFEQIRKHLGGVAGARATRRSSRSDAAVPAPGKPVVVLESRDLKEAYVSLAFRIPSLSHPDTPALDLAAVLLGQGDSSRTVRRLRHELQLVTDVSVYAYTPREPGLLIVDATANPRKLYAAVEAIAKEVFDLGLAPVATDELRRAKTIIESDAVYQKETVQGQARKLGFYQTVAGAVEFEHLYARKVEATTAEELVAVAARHLRPEALAVAVLGPPPAKGEAAARSGILEAIRSAAAASRRTRAQVTRTDEVTKVTLENGARLLVLSDPSVPLVAMRAVWNGGLRYETARDNGINNLLAALATRGTLSRSADQINEAIEGMAGAIGGFSGMNSFGVHAELLASRWEQGFEILADCILHPALKDEEVERARRQAIEEIRSQQDSVATVAMQLFQRTLYKKHPHRMNALGTVEAVSALGRGELEAYQGRYFSPGLMTLAVVGDVDPARVRAKFEQLFGAAPAARGRPPSIPVEPERKSPEDAYVLLDKQQAHIIVGYPGTTMRSPDRYALEVLAALLSGQSGRLFAELRNRRGLAYQIGAYTTDGIEPGHLAVYLSTSPEKVKGALEAIEAQLEDLRARPVPAAELKRVQRHLVGTFEISLQRKATVASYLAFNECYGLGHKSYLRYVPSVLAVTAAEVQKAARRYLAPGRRVVAIVKPEEESPAAARRMGGNREAGVVRSGAPQRAEGKAEKGKGGRAAAKKGGGRAKTGKKDKSSK